MTELSELRTYKRMQEENIRKWERQLDRLLDLIQKRTDENAEQARLIERLESRHSDYKAELVEMIENANKWRARAIKCGWKPK